MPRNGLPVEHFPRLPLARGAAVGLWSADAAVMAVLLWRKLAGALTITPSSLPVCLGVAAVAAVGLAAARLWGRGDAPPTCRAAAPSAVATLVPAVVLAIVLAPTHSAAAIAGLTILLLAATGGWLLLQAEALSIASASGGRQPPGLEAPVESRENRGADAPRSPEHTDLTDIRSVLPSDGEQPVPYDESAHSTAAAPLRLAADESHVVQWTTRRVTPEGDDVLEGAVTVHFQPGQKQAAVHLVFCPPFSRPPEIECEPLDQADLRLKTGPVYAYGARIEARRTDTSATHSEIGFTAIAPAADTDAA